MEPRIGTGQLAGVDLAAECAQNFTISEIAERHAVTYDTVRFALKRHGLRAHPEKADNCRRLIRNMSPDEAILFLLEIIEQQYGATPEALSVIDGWGVHFTIKERQVLSILLDAAPRCVSYDAIYDNLYSLVPNADDLPQKKIVQVLVCKIRKKLPAEIGRIDTLWGRGLVFIPNDAEEPK